MRAEKKQASSRRCRAGDQDAFRDLLGRFHPRAFGVAYALTRDRVKAAEVEQETFIKAWRGLATLRGDVCAKVADAR